MTDPLTPGDPVASIRLGVHFGPGEGKRFLNVEYPFDGTPEDFDRVIEYARVKFHEAASASDRPCGYGGPWAATPTGGLCQKLRALGLRYLAWCNRAAAS